jgi:hypothetical protein
VGGSHKAKGKEQYQAKISNTFTALDYVTVYILTKGGKLLEITSEFQAMRVYIIMN